jgi:hypothetical protein
MELFDVPDLINQDEPTSDPHRSPGLHVSTLIASAARKLGHLDAEDGWDERSTLRAELGCAWEDRLGAKLERVSVGCFTYHPGEISRDGIIGTPDGEEFLDVQYRRSSPSSLRVYRWHEIKATWVSAKNPKYDKRPGRVSWMHEAQVKAYCAMSRHPVTGVHRITEGVLHRLYLNGSYKPPLPYHWSLGVRFTPDEIESFWETVILSEAEEMGHAI